MEELARCKSSLYSLRRVSMYGYVVLLFQMFYSGVLVDVHQYIWRLEQYPECPTHGDEEKYIEEETVYHQRYVLPVVLNLKQSLTEILQKPIILSSSFNASKSMEKLIYLT